MPSESPVSRDHYSTIRTGDLVVDLETSVVTANGERVWLTAKEYGILELLSLHRGPPSPRRCFLATSTAEGTSRGSGSSVFLSAICAKSWHMRRAVNTISRPFAVGAIGSAIWWKYL